MTQSPHSSQHFLDIIADQLEVLKASSRSIPIDLSTIDVRAPLADKEHNVLITEEQNRNMLKNKVEAYYGDFASFYKMLVVHPR